MGVYCIDIYMTIFIYMQYIIIHIQVSGENATSGWIQNCTFVKMCRNDSVDLFETWIPFFSSRIQTL